MVEKIGTEKLMAVAFASGRRMIARKFSAIASMPKAMRATCAPTRLVRSDAKPEPIMTSAVAQTVDPICR